MTCDVKINHECKLYIRLINAQLRNKKHPVFQL